MHWYSQVKVFLCLLSVSTVFGIVGISSSEAKPSSTAQKSDSGLKSKEHSKVGQLKVKPTQGQTKDEDIRKRDEYRLQETRHKPSNNSSGVLHSSSFSSQSSILHSSSSQSVNRHSSILHPSNSQAVNHHPLILKPSTQQTANSKPSTQQTANIESANPKPSTLQTANSKPPEQSNINVKLPNPEALTLHPANFHRSNRQASILQPAILDPSVLEAAIVEAAIVDPFILELAHQQETNPKAVVNTARDTFLQLPSTRRNERGITFIHERREDDTFYFPEASIISYSPSQEREGIEELDQSNPSPIGTSVIDPINLEDANLQASNLRASVIHPARVLDANVQASTLNHPIDNEPATGESPKPDLTANSVPYPPSLGNDTQPQPQQSILSINPPSANTKQNTETPNESVQIQVERIQVTGSTIFGDAELNPITAPLEGRTVTLEDLRTVADAISQLYLERGYITSRAVIVGDPPSGPVVEIQIIEGSLEEIQVEGTRRINESYVRSRVRLGAGTPLNTANLEDQLRLLRIDPLFENVEASLRAGTGVGQSILVVRVTEANPFDGNVSIDNYSPPSVGSERSGANVRYRNLTGIGDEITAAYNRTTAGGANTWEFGYRVPINPMNGTIQARASLNRNEVIQEPFRTLDIRGESQLYELTYRQPFIRTPREEFALSLGFTFQDGQTFTFAGPTPFGFGPDEEGRSRTSVFKFGQDYTRRDVAGAWAFRSLFSFGTGLFNATDNSEIDPNFPDGQFISWLAQVQRVQVLNPDNFLIIQADLQLALDGLLPAQQFVIGGGQSVRGYRQNVRAGDNGFRVSIEDRITLERNEAGIATFVLAPFLDVGYVWNVSGNPNILQDQRFIAGLGVGLLWEPLPNINLRLDYGLSLVNLEDQGGNAQDRGFYFSVNYNF